MKKALATFWKQTAEAMSGKPSIDDMTGIIKQIAKRLGEIDERLPVIRYDGIERSRIIEHGTPEELIALDEELKELQAEETQLRYRSSELNKRKRTAEVETGIRNAPGNRKNLTGAVEEALKAERTFLRARGKAAAIAEDVMRARFGAREQGFDNGDCWLETVDLMRLAQMLYPGDDKSDQERRFEWSRDKARTVQDMKAVAIGNDSISATSKVQLAGSSLSPGRQLS